MLSFVFTCANRFLLSIKTAASSYVNVNFDAARSFHKLLPTPYNIRKCQQKNNSKKCVRHSVKYNDLKEKVLKLVLNPHNLPNIKNGIDPAVLA